MTAAARTVFLGSGAFGVPVLKALAEHPAVELVAAVTAPQRLGSRGRPTDPPVAVRATELGVPMLRPARLRDADAVAAVEALRPELLVLADYGQIVPAALLDIPRHGALNLHPSLLPRHRGASPIPAAILAGDAETGVTLMLMDAGLDSGPIVAQTQVPLQPEDTAPLLEARLADTAAALLSDRLEDWLAGAIEPRPQDERRATMTRTLRREDGRLDPRRTAAELERQVRAYQPWPGSWIETPAGRLIVWRAHVGAESLQPPAAGALITQPGGGLSLAAADRLLDLDEVQLAGGRRMTAAELLRGRPGIV